MEKQGTIHANKKRQVSNKDQIYIQGKALDEDKFVDSGFSL